VGIASPIIYMIFCIAIKLKYRTVASPQEEGVSDMEKTVCFTSLLLMQIYPDLAKGHKQKY
jgi:hypothetical protein